MHEIEPSGFCPISEYQRYLQKRIQASEISVGGLYMALAALKGEKEDKKAFKFPIRAVLVEMEAGEIATLNVNLLDEDLRPKCEVSLRMCDGLITDPEIWEVSTSQRVAEMYIKDYEDFMPLGPFEVNVGQEVEELELVGV